MITIGRYSKDKYQEWNIFLSKAKNNLFMFNRNFMEYHSDRFVDYSLMFYNDNELIALLPASIHDNELRSHGGLTYGGFITSEKMKQHTMNECFDVLLEYLKQQNIKKFLYKVVPHIYHTAPAEEDLYPLWQKGRLVRCDVSSTINLQNILKMPKGRKAQISRAKREGVVIKETDDFEQFIILENQILQSRHNTIAVHTAEELRLLKERFPENIRLMGAIYQGRMIAASLLFIYPTVVHTQYMAADDTAREIGGLDLLIKTVIDEYAQNKLWFDFGISTEQNGKIFNDGLCAQKEGFGARTITYNFYELEV